MELNPFLMVRQYKTCELIAKFKEGRFHYLHSFDK